MLIRSSDTFKNDMFHFSLITFHVLNLEPCSLSWNPSRLFLPGSFLILIMSVPVSCVVVTPHNNHVYSPQCIRYKIRSAPVLTGSSQVMSSSWIPPTSGSKTEEVIKVFLIGKRCLGASCVCQHMLMQGLQFPHCRRAVPTVWGNFQRCCNRSAFQCVFHFSLLAVKGVIAMRQTASACAEFRFFWKSTTTWAIRCLCLSLLCWSWQWVTDSCMRPSTVRSSLITLFTSAFINLPYWMLPEVLTNVLHHRCCLMGPIPGAVKILLEKHLRKNV